MTQAETIRAELAAFRRAAARVGRSMATVEALEQWVP